MMLLHVARYLKHLNQIWFFYENKDTVNTVKSTTAESLVLKFATKYTINYKIKSTQHH